MPSFDRSQRGVSLIELLVGLTVGLLVLAAALGTLVLSRGAATSVSEMSQLQQQGSYALRVIGNQFRQAGSIEVLKTSAGLYAFDNRFLGFNGGATVVLGQDGANGAPDRVSVSNQPPAPGELSPANAPITLQRDCIGTSVTDGIRIDSTFYVSNGQLYCKGKAAVAQPVIDNVADFQVSYRVRTAAGSRSMTAAAVEMAGAWASVAAIEVCIDLRGEAGGHPDIGTYETCRADTVGKTVRAARAGHLHLVFRNVFNLRTQGGT
ncbi:MAG: prepilin-type N-terminal cleavage/methylation domain-containing protein [Luteibacter sp.]